MKAAMAACMARRVFHKLTSSPPLCYCTAWHRCSKATGGEAQSGHGSTVRLTGGSLCVSDASSDTHERSSSGAPPRFAGTALLIGGDRGKKNPAIQAGRRNSVGMMMVSEKGLRDRFDIWSQSVSQLGQNSLAILQ